MAMKRCPVCGERYSDTYKNCPFCEEDEYWEDDQDARRPMFREGTRSKSAYGIVTPILIVLILLMAALLLYLLYGSKLKPKSKDDNSGKVGVEDPLPSSQGTIPDDDPAGTTPEDPEGTTPDNTTDNPSPDGGTMPEGSGDTGTTPSGGGTSSGGMSYASAAALPSGLSLNITDFTRKVSEGAYKLRVSGGTGSYTWISENPSVATVGSDGTVTPVASGTTNIVVTDGSKRAICIVRVSGSSAPAPSGGGTSTAPSTGGNTGSTGSGTLKTGNAVVTNAGNGVRVRSGPGTNYDILASLSNGSSVRIVSSAGNGWYEITFTASGGATTTGYMMGDYLANS